jgi:Domain of unknown function (DUF4340)
LVGLGALVIVAGALGLFAWKGVYEKDRVAVTQKAQNEKLFDAPKPDGGPTQIEFTKLSITFEGKTTTLSREPGKPWQITSPVRAKADRLVVDAITSLLQQSKFKSTIDENPDQAALEQYGLLTPIFVVEASAGPRTLTLEGGVENTFDGSIFMRRDGAKPVYAAEGGARYTLAKRTFDLRDKQVTAIDEGALTRIRVTSQANDWVLERNAEGQWAFVKPFSELGDPTQITAMLGLQSNERAQAFLDQGNFDKPLLDATFTPKVGPPLRLRFAGLGERLLVLREDADGPVIAELGPKGLQLDRNAMDLKDKAVLRFKKELVTRIEFTSPSGKVVLGRESVDASAESWRVLEPRPGKAKVFKVTSVLWTLSSFKALSWGETNPKNWGHYGLDAKGKSVTLLGPQGQQLGRFVIGNAVPTQPGAFYVRGSRDQVALSAGERFAEFPWVVDEALDEATSDAGP